MGLKLKRCSNPERERLTQAALRAMRRAYACSRAHSRLAGWAERRFGDGGPLISGCVREHFPTQVKDVLRSLARQVGGDLDASRAEWRAARRKRSTWMREKERIIAEDGRGYYG